MASRSTRASSGFFGLSILWRISLYLRANRLRGAWIKPGFFTGIFSAPTRYTCWRALAGGGVGNGLRSGGSPGAGSGAGGAPLLERLGSPMIFPVLTMRPPMTPRLALGRQPEELTARLPAKPPSTGGTQGALRARLAPTRKDWRTLREPLTDGQLVWNPCP